VADTILATIGAAPMESVGPCGTVTASCRTSPNDAANALDRPPLLRLADRGLIAPQSPRASAPNLPSNPNPSREAGAGHPLRGLERDDFLKIQTGRASVARPYGSVLQQLSGNL
jgi:hypothetical protein